MAGTASRNRGGEFERVSSSESNNYYSGGSDSSSPMKPGFGPGLGKKMRSPRDPNNNSNGTMGPSTNGTTNKGDRARS